MLPVIDPVLSMVLPRICGLKHQVVADVDRVMAGIEVYAPGASCVISVVFAWIYRSEVAGRSRHFCAGLLSSVVNLSGGIALLIEVLGGSYLVRL
jgi:hypothetical protein